VAPSHSLKPIDCVHAPLSTDWEARDGAELLCNKDFPKAQAQ